MFPAIFAVESPPPLASETVFNLFGLDITNSMLFGLLVGLFILIIFITAASRMKVRGNSLFVYIIEVITVFMLDTIKGNFNGDEKKARKFLPMFIAFFLFILLNNLFGLLPGMGGTVYVTTTEGIKYALLRPFTTDLNGTLALAIIAMGTVWYYGVKEHGLVPHIKHYFSIMKPWWNPMNFLLGPLEIMTELIRLATLALRLFGVIYAGEVLLHVITSLTGNFSWIATVPIIFMEIFFSAIQAYLFIMLSSVYLSISTTPLHEETNHSSPDSVKLETSVEKN
ncbi:MAG: F0F1 ATP synthase subunit A [Candidatus Saccharibacteria bacterium]